MSEFHNRLKELRLNNNIMAKTMAELLSITPRNYQRYENGEVAPQHQKQLFLQIILMSPLISLLVEQIAQILTNN